MNANTPLYYDRKTGKIINDVIEANWPEKKHLDLKAGMVPKGAYVSDDGYVIIKPNGNLLTIEEYNMQHQVPKSRQTITEIINETKEEPIIDDAFLKILNERSVRNMNANPNIENPNVNSNQNNYETAHSKQYENAHAKSVATQKKSQERKRKSFVFRPKTFFITLACVVIIEAIPYGVNFIKNENIIQSENKVYAQIYNENHNTDLKEINFVTPYKYNTGSYDSNGEPAWAYNYDNIVKNFLTYDDTYFVSNFKKLYNDLSYTRNWAYDETSTIMDHLTGKIAYVVEQNPDKYPTAFKFLQGVRSFDGFLQKNYSMYAGEKDNLEDVYKKTVRKEIIIEAPRMENEYMDINELLSEDEMSKGGRN